MQKKLALQTLFFLTAWLVLHNFNVAATRMERPASPAEPLAADGGKSRHSTTPFDKICRPASAGAFSIPDNYRIKKVVIDAGHGGKDPGCIGATSREKHNTLAIALKLGAFIEENCPDVQVIYTRTTDVFVELKERAAIANRHKADLFISIHCNAISAPHFHGAETYVLGLHRAGDNLEVAKRENAVIVLEDNYKQNYAGYDPASPEAHILGSMWQSAYLEQSILFASLVQQYAHSLASRADKGVKQAGFLVLRETAMPAVLVETGFLTNRTEELFIASEEGQTQMAQAIFEAFLDYRAQLEGTPRLRPKPAPPVVRTAPQTTNEPAASATTATTPASKPVPGPAAPPAKTSGPSATPKPVALKTTPAKPANSWRIHLFSWPARMDTQSGQLALLDNVQEEKGAGEYRYYTGAFADKAEAERMLPEIINLGFRLAQVVPGQNGPDN